MYRRMLPVILVAGLLSAACGAAATVTPQPSDTPGPAAPQATVAPRSAATATPRPSDTPRPATPQAAATATPDQSTALGKPGAIGEEQSREELERARFSTSEWRSTNFRIRSVPLREFRGGGPGKDDIPPIDAPKFETVEQADKWLGGREAVQVVEIKGDARAYPQQILIWHEVVNDTVGGEPVTVTY